MLNTLVTLSKANPSATLIIFLLSIAIVILVWKLFFNKNNTKTFGGSESHDRQSGTVNQNHSGSGDNVGGDKISNHK